MQRPALIIIVATALIAAGCEKSPSLSTYRTVVANIRAGIQPVATTGEVVLPPAQASSVCNGKAYATTQPPGTVMVLFPTWWGKGENLRGYLYSSGPALAGGSTAQVIVPVPSPAAAPQFESTEIQIDRVVAPGWYYVSRTLD